MIPSASRLRGFPRWVVEEYWVAQGRSVLTAPAHLPSLVWSVRKARSLLPETARITGTAVPELKRWLRGLRERRFAEEILKRSPKATRRWSAQLEFLYLFVRAVKPRVMVETGVELGTSSAYALLAMADNDAGELWSVDLPTLGPQGRVDRDGRLDRAHVDRLEQTGEAIPERLRGRWHLRLGDARELLPTLPAPEPWDIFYHDSEHSRAQMLWEYGIAWPHLRAGGLLLSDDVPNNDAFVTFARSVGREPFLWMRDGTLRKS